MERTARKCPGEGPHSDLLRGARVFIERRVKSVDATLAQATASDPRLPLLVRLPGVGLAVAATILAAIGPISRFASAKEFVGHGGLGTRVHDSGETHKSGRITKAGRRDLRSAMVEAASGGAVPPPLGGLAYSPGGWSKCDRVHKTASGQAGHRAGTGEHPLGDEAAKAASFRFGDELALSELRVQNEADVVSVEGRARRWSYPKLCPPSARPLNDDRSRAKLGADQVGLGDQQREDYRYYTR